ncbi:hypothetical protein AcW1_008853 [Taiwanofungus camphoratus]|nr:hypothetical protein AcV7_007143 [Antrodia cinnamomea]KAI0949162.1 hypothetical protein AcW1_008853 [Antrodia cinnamomea]
MDNIFAIGVGLVLRAIIDAVTNHNHRVNGSLVGLWEGAVLHHFLAKFPSSFDPYVAFGFRLFIDLLFTESLTRMTIVVLWTAMGMLLTDVGVDMMEDKRFRRLWRRIRRSLPFLGALPSSRTPSRVQFIQIPSTSTVSSNAARSPPLRPYPRSQPSQPRPQPPPTPARRPSSRPLPGSFSEWSEAETDASREQQRAPSELEYINLPVIPDTPAQESPPEFGGRSASIASGLTTPTEGSFPRIVVDGPPENHSGLTTPVDRPSTPITEQLPPVTIIDENDEGHDHERTPTMNPTELVDLPPIPIPSRLIADTADETPNEQEEQEVTFPEPQLIMPEILDPQPSPGLQPPIESMLDISTPDSPNHMEIVAEDGDNADLGAPTDAPVDAEVAVVERESANRSPPPSYDQAEQVAADNRSNADTEAGESDITAHSRDAIITRADDLRKQAEDAMATMSRLKREYEEANRNKEYWSAFRLKVECERAKEDAKLLHAKAARRYWTGIMHLLPKVMVMKLMMITSS